MATHNKITLASEMFVEAHRRFKIANRDIDYVVSIVMSGSVMGIVSPLLTEQGGHTAHSILARISTKLDGKGAPHTKEGMFRLIYNGLKHAGDKSRSIGPSSDLLLDVHLAREAAHMLDDAKADFRQIKITRDVRSNLSPEFLALLESNESYA
jgi:hypothetical protein